MLYPQRSVLKYDAFDWPVSKLSDAVSTEICVEI